MCMVSAIIANGIQQWEYNPHKLPPQDYWQKYIELVKKAAEFDKTTNQPDCEESKKAKWLEDMNTRITGIEQTLKEILEKI